VRDPNHCSRHSSNLVDLALLRCDDVVGDLVQVGLCQATALRSLGHLDRLPVMRNHRVDEGLVEGHLPGEGRLLTARRPGAVVAARDYERDRGE
jgi:hypothetical protein